jgi:tetratricopeptide (TPR) repeat protein
VRLLVFLCVLPLAAQKLPECQSLQHHGKIIEAKKCFAELAASNDPYLAAEGLWGVARYQEANNKFRDALKAAPKDQNIRVRWGRLFLERFNKEEAATLFQEALHQDESYAPALLGMAMVASNGFESKAVEFAQKAIDKDPKYVEARELLARLALEDNNEPKAIEEADKALQLSSEALDAMAIRAIIEWLNDRPGKEWEAKILAINPAYGEAWETAGHFFVINRRYEEGIRHYRRALELTPSLWSARSELGVNLMRLGEEKEAHDLLEACYQNGYKNAATVNTLRLMDSYKNFVTIKSGNMILKLHKKEADLLKIYFEPELAKAVSTFEKKYGTKLDHPVQLEVYPDHDDFAVRTMGLPGLGALGVTFGYVVAMDSPSGRKPGTFHWASTMWHELSHVYVLSATKHRVPRWFTEGLAVHEETAVSPEWGDRLDPEAISAIKNKKLLPIAELDKGFVRPSYPAQVTVSYFQAGKICDYINQKWGWVTLMAMMHDYAESKKTEDVVRTRLEMTPEAFDKEFLAWLDKQTATQVAQFDNWRKQLREVSTLIKEKKFDDVIKVGASIRDLYPDYVEAGSVYELLAEAYVEQKNEHAAVVELTTYMTRGGRSPSSLKLLAKLLEKNDLKREAAGVLERINYIFPVQDEAMHREQGEDWLAAGNNEKAVREFQAAVASKPIDLASSYYNLAKALRAAGRVDQARDNLIQALEAAPSYRPAQKMLLELSNK